MRQLMHVWPLQGMQCPRSPWVYHVPAIIQVQCVPVFSPRLIEPVTGTGLVYMGPGLVYTGPGPVSPCLTHSQPVPFPNAGYVLLDKLLLLYSGVQYHLREWEGLVLPQLKPMFFRKIAFLG